MTQNIQDINQLYIMEEHPTAYNYTQVSTFGRN